MTRRKIRELRVRLGLTQGEMAFVLGISEESVESYELGRRNPSGEVEDKLLKLEKKAKEVE